MNLYLETFYTVMEHFQIKEKNFVYHKIQLFIFIAYFLVENISQRLEMCPPRESIGLPRKLSRIVNHIFFARDIRSR